MTALAGLLVAFVCVKRAEAGSLFCQLCYAPGGIG